MKATHSLRGLRLLAILLASVFAAVAVFPQEAEAAPRKKKKPKSSLPREPGSIYLSDFTTARVKLTVRGTPPIYKTTSRKSAIGLLKKGKEVELVAMTEKLYRVRGAAQHGPVVGWVLPSQLEPLEKEFVKNMKLLYERQKKVEALIEKGEIALGMTADEVAESLGRPNRKKSKLDKGGRIDVYEYVTYKKVPQFRYVRGNDGQLYRDTYYVKVESGKLTVSFKDKIVQSIEETEGEPLGGAKVRIITPPIILR